MFDIDSILNVTIRISAQFGFIPITRPPPFPPLRRLAYQEESPLLGPTVDPDGWHFKDSITIRGIFNNRPVLVGCTVSAFIESTTSQSSPC
jgi:hypothetical protein